MNEIELLEIEKELNISLPDEYIGVMKNFEKFELDEDECGLFNDSELIIGINKGFRNGEFGEYNWPDNYFTFGHDGGGNHYFINLEESTYSIYMIDHETHQIEKVFNNLEELIIDLDG
jgi:hypothetical protein